MSVREFVRGKPPPLWRLDHRNAEGGLWSTLERARRQRPLRDEAAAPRIPLGVGDLLALVDPEGAVRACWVVTPGGTSPAGRLPAPLREWRGPSDSDFDWPYAWERAPYHAHTLLGAVGALDRARVLLVGCDLTDAILALPGRAADPSDDAARALVAVVRRWARGRADYGDAQRAARDLGGRLPLTAGGDVDVLFAAAAGAEGEAVKKLAGSLLSLVNAACLRGGCAEGGAYGALRDMAAIVRRRVPLSALLLRRAGAEVPPPPDP